MKPRFFGLAAVAAVLCVSCSIVYNYPPAEPPSARALSGSIAYSIHVHYSNRTPLEPKRALVYAEAIERVLRENGFSDPVRLDDEDLNSPNVPRLKLLIDVELLSINYDYGHAAAPQEWVTGLTFGLIPSWARRHEVKISFDLWEADQSIRHWEYTPKTLWINHLLFFPVYLYEIGSTDDDRKAGQVAAATGYFMGAPPE